MAISQTKQAQLTTPEVVYDQPPTLRPNSTNSSKNRLSTGAITGMAVGGVVACALSFVVGMQVGILQNGGMNNRAGGPPSMSQGQSNQQGGPSGQTGGALGGGQNQTQNSQTPSTRNNNSAAQNNQATPSGQSESTPQAPNNTSPQVN